MVALGLAALIVGAAHANVVLRIGVTNPSTFQEQETMVRQLLPAGITPQHVLDAAGLDVVYDEQAEQYAVAKKVLLQPGENKVFEIQLEDIWLIDPVEAENFRRLAEAKTKDLAGREYETQAGELKARIDQHVATILERQEAAMVPRVSPAEHISAYHNNRALLEAVRTDLASMDVLLNRAASIRTLDKVPAGIPPNVGMIWRVVFIIITFVGVISVIFFVIWSLQLRKIRSVEREEGLSGGDAG